MTSKLCHSLSNDNSATDMYRPYSKMLWVYIANISARTFTDFIRFLLYGVIATFSIWV